MMDIITILSGICFALGAVAILIGAWGLITLKDVYSRIHAAGMIDTAGVAFFVLGMMLISGWSLVTVKLCLIGVFMILTSPISGHAIVQVARASGHQPEGRDLTAKKPAKKSRQSS
jgi:multicomponent Na+:H+ antiporter subunit G